MNKSCNKKGFSLAEILMAMGILSIGILFIAAVFPAGLYLTTISTERTIASVVADEAFAKIWLSANDPNANFNPSALDVEFSLFPPGPPVHAFFYEYDPNTGYCWSAIWRRLPSDPTGRNVQVTVFISRKAGVNSIYHRYDDLITPHKVVQDGKRPSPVPVEVWGAAGYNTKINIANPDYINFLTEGCSVIDSETGLLYRVLSHDPAEPTIVNLDRMYAAGKNPPKVWVVPPPVGGGRTPCIAVFQKIIRF